MATAIAPGSNGWVVRSRSTGRTMRVEAVWPGVAAHLVNGQTEPEVQGWVFPEYRRRVPAPVLELSARGRSLRLLTVLELPSERSSRPSARALLARRAADFVELRALEALWDERRPASP